MRAIRAKRGMTVARVAEAMHLSRRSYEEFEGGRGRLTLERIFAFGNATNSDPFALILCIVFHNPQFAVDCSDIKLAFILATHLHDFWEEEEGDISFLEPLHIIGGSERLFADLSDKLADNDAFLRKWTEKRTGWIDLPALRLRGVKRRKRKD